MPSEPDAPIDPVRWRAWPSSSPYRKNSEFVGHSTKQKTNKQSLNTKAHDSNQGGGGKKHTET